MESEGESGECDEDDPKVGKEAIRGDEGDPPVGVRRIAKSGIEWGDISEGERSESTVQGVESKEVRYDYPKSGGVSSVGGGLGLGSDFSKGKGVYPKSIGRECYSGEGGFGFSGGEGEGDSKGRKKSVSGISYQHSHPIRLHKEEGDTVVYHRSGGFDGRSQHEHVSLFVGNIPVSLSSSRLKMIFMAFGDVTDVFIPQKASKISNSRFAFVRFKSTAEAERAIHGMDGAEIEGYILMVNLARFSRAGSLKLQSFQNASVNLNRAEQWKPLPEVSGGLSYAQVVQNSEDHLSDSPSVKKKISTTAGNLEWLSASLVGTLRVGHEFGKVKNSLIGLSEEIIEVSYAGGCRCLITFSSALSRDRAMMDSVWSKWFFSMEPWKVESLGGLHRCWITCVGVPVTAWNVESFALIGKQWGRLIDVDEGTLNRSQFVVACLLIESNGCVINESLELDVDGNLYNVQVSSSFQNGMSQVLGGKASEDRDDRALVDTNTQQIVQAKTKDQAATVSSSFHNGMSQVLGGKASEERDYRALVDTNSHQMFQSKAKDQAATVRNLSGGPRELKGLPLSFVSTSNAGVGLSGLQLLSENEPCPSEDISPVLYGFTEENAIRILDEDAGCLIRIMGKEGVCRPVLDVCDLSGGYCPVGGPEEFPHNGKSHSVVLDVCGNSQTDVSTSGSMESVGDGHALLGIIGLGDKLGRFTAPEEEEGIEKIHDQVGVKTAGEGGGAVKITMDTVKKFVASQEFIDSSTNLTTDVLVECKMQGIIIPESVQRVVIEAMTKRHIQAEEDFYAETSSG